MGQPALRRPRTGRQANASRHVFSLERIAGNKEITGNAREEGGISRRTRWPPADRGANSQSSRRTAVRCLPPRSIANSRLAANRSRLFGLRSRSALSGAFAIALPPSAGAAPQLRGMARPRPQRPPPLPLRRPVTANRACRAMPPLLAIREA